MRERERVEDGELEGMPTIDINKRSRKVSFSMFFITLVIRIAVYLRLVSSMCPSAC